jgi:hypothetical protein
MCTVQAGVTADATNPATSIQQQLDAAEEELADVRRQMDVEADKGWVDKKAAFELSDRAQELNARVWHLKGELRKAAGSQR